MLCGQLSTFIQAFDYNDAMDLPVASCCTTIILLPLGLCKFHLPSLVEFGGVHFASLALTRLHAQLCPTQTLVCLVDLSSLAIHGYPENAFCLI